MSIIPRIPLASGRVSLIPFAWNQGTLWIATDGGGLKRFNRHTGRFHAYRHNPSDSASISSNAVTCVYQDRKGTLWVGTREGGLNRFDAKTEKFTSFTTREGLPNDYVTGILEDRQGRLWISTQKGLCSFDPQYKVFSSYDVADGLPSSEFLTGAVHKNGKGQLYFGAVNGFTVFHPDSIRTNTYRPPVKITGFHLFGQLVDFNKQPITLSYRENFIGFDFVALSYLNAERNQYAYRLEGLDKDWIASGTRRYASYTNLDPGQYVFKVKASNSDGVWNEQGDSITIIIAPPFWRTGWAYSLYGLLLLGALFIFDRLQRQRLIAQERERSREKELAQAREIEKANRELEQQKEELQTTLEDLKTTQVQLIQKEKMASLGELTAGIAHEIQNPLNFVNNFSEVSQELVEELREGPIQELKTATKAKAEAIIADLVQNLQKIHHHGQRADSIVKGMLQQSRTASGEKHPTDLYALAEKYLRLSYHSLRAKDQHFTAMLVTDFDASLEKVAVIPQELGRVLLNLFNNAFYATAQKKGILNGQYEPEVKVSTKKIGNKVEISVKDNGTGIPQNVKQKIFQPFFTTKPPGQGTGLGLSLSYDIITKGHGGELKVESKEGEFSEFNIILPTNNF